VKCRVNGRNINASMLQMKTERDQDGIHNPWEGRPKAPERGKRCRHDKPPSSCHRQGRSHAEATVTIISDGVEISIAGGGADEKDERKQVSFFLYCFLISYIH